MVPIPSEQQILTRIYNKIKTDTTLSASLDSSTIGILLRLIAREMSLWWNALDEIDRQSNLSTATGTSLDNFGLLFGVPRKLSSQATTAGLAPAVRFTNNGNQSITIPNSTRVFRAANPQIAFFTIEGATLFPSQSVDLHVTAAQVGDIYNVGARELDSHNLPNVSVTVTNILPIQNGSLSESDASYRQRILQEMQRRNVLNPANTDSLLRSVPGVQDVYLLDKYRGAGTFDVVIIPYNQSATSDVVAACQSLLNDNVPVGISAIARAPQYRQLDISVVVRFASDAPNPETTRQNIRAQIQSMISNLPVENGTGNGTFFTSKIKAVAVLTDSSILDAVVNIGMDGTPQSNSGSISLGVGERLVLRSLSVQ